MSGRGEISKPVPLPHPDGQEVCEKEKEKGDERAASSFSLLD